MAFPSMTTTVAGRAEVPALPDLQHAPVSVSSQFAPLTLFLKLRLKPASVEIKRQLPSTESASLDKANVQPRRS